MSFNSVNFLYGSELQVKIAKLGIKNKEDLNEFLEKSSLSINEFQAIASNLEIGDKELTVEESLALFIEYKAQNAVYMDSLAMYINSLSAKNNTQTTNETVEETNNDLSEGESAESSTTKITNPIDIENYLNTLNSNLKGDIEKELGDINDINEIEISQTGQIIIKTDKMEITADHTKITNVNAFSGTVEENTQNVNVEVDILASNTTDTVEDSTTTQNVSNTTTVNEETPQTVDVTNVETAETTIQNETIEETTSNTQVEKPQNEQGVELEVTTNTDANTTTVSGTGGLYDELDNLIEERDETQQDLDQQQTSFNETATERDDVIDNIDNEIATEETNLDNAEIEVENAETEVEEATEEVEIATDELISSEEDLEVSESDLNDATEEVQDATDNSNTAATENQQRVQEEQNAQQESNVANNNLSTATNNTNAAQNTANQKSDDLKEAVGASNEAYSVLNQANSEVAAAQTEYNNAQAQASSGIEGAWNKFKNWVSQAWNKLKAAITKRDAAEVEAEQKEQEKERAQVASDQAQAELQTRKSEQITAEQVAEAAQVVLDKATNAREVSDQEYADALIILATAMDTRAEAEDEYNSALETYMEVKGYKADADGKLVDAEGNLVSAKQVAADIENYIGSLSSERNEEEAFYNGILNTISGVIAGDQEKITTLNTEIEEVKQEIEEQEKLIAIQDAMLATMVQEKSAFNAQEETDGIGDDILELFGAGSKPQEKELEEKQAALEQALLTGSKEDILAAYKAIYGDKEIIIDENNNILDPATLSEDQLAKYQPQKLSDIDINDPNLYNIMVADSQKIIKSSEVIDSLINGEYTFNGEVITKEELIDILSSQNIDINQELLNTIENQDFLTTLLSDINSVFGLGTTSENAEAQIAIQQKLIDELSTCKTASEFAAMYKAITGQDFDQTDISALLIYNEMKNPSENGLNIPADGTENKNDFTEAVSIFVEACKNGEEVNANYFSLLKDTEATKSIHDYKYTTDLKYFLEHIGDK